MEQKKWSLLGIVGTYSIGTFLTLKVGLVPKETTSPQIHMSNLLEFCEHLLKVGVAHLASPLQNIINASIKKGEFPSNWKKR